MDLPQVPEDPFSVDEVGWIIRLRWVALGGILSAAALSLTGAFGGVNWRVLLAAVGAAGLYNVWLSRRHHARAISGRREAMRQAIFDLVLLTVVLWAAGGLQTPFVGYYVFHVAIAGILAGRGATLVAALSALFGALLLLVVDYVPALQIARWEPVFPFDLVAQVTAFGTTVGAVAYLATHASDALRLRERILEETRDRAALELEVLSTTLDELEAGLEVVEREGEVLWRNKRAEELAPVQAETHRWVCPGERRPCEQDARGHCPVRAALREDASGSCRFAAQVDGKERVFEMQVFPLGQGPGGRPRVMNLYVDRTAALVAERRLLLAERLASLGRVTQGVAHELNTPLATIRTLSRDMLKALEGVDEAHRSGLLKDMGESAELIHDETRRLGRITQGLLTGRDLTSSRIEGGVPLLAVVERAVALVFAGDRRQVPVHVDEALHGERVTADSDQLVQVLVNLLQNAHDAVKDSDDGRVSVSVDVNGDQVSILVEDNGPGIPESLRARLFEPFATTKPPGEGTGLGLYTSYMLIDGMHGTMSLTPRSEGGTRASVSLPRSDERPISIKRSSRPPSYPAPEYGVDRKRGGPEEVAP